MTAFVTDGKVNSAKQALRTAFWFDKRLLESALAFGNGEAARAAFGWVGAAVGDRAKEAGFTAEEVRALRWSDDFVHIGPDDLIWKFRAALGWASAMDREKSERGFRARQDEWFSEKLASVQIVSRWRMVNGVLIESVVPKINSVERCIAYAVGIYLLDRHGLRQAVKQCPFVSSPLSGLEAFFGRSRPGNVPHWFLQWPLSKRRFCCDQHAATYRQREKRKRDEQA